MSKPFLVVNIVDGELGAIHQRPDFEDAVDLAVALALEQVEGGDPVAIKEELEVDCDWISGYGDIRIYIAQIED